MWSVHAHQLAHREIEARPVAGGDVGSCSQGRRAPGASPLPSAPAEGCFLCRKRPGIPVAWAAVGVWGANT